MILFSSCFAMGKGPWVTQDIPEIEGWTWLLPHTRSIISRIAPHFGALPYTYAC